MSFGQALRNSYRELQQSWARLADSAFGKDAQASRNEMARGEFISDFITDRGLGVPERPRRP